MSIISTVEGLLGVQTVSNPPPPQFSVGQATADPKSAQIASGISQASALAATVPVAGPILSSGIKKVGEFLLAAHTERLHNAISENQAIPEAVAAFDKDITEIVNELARGQINAQQAIAYLDQVDSQVYSYMHSLVGKTGTAWNGGPGKCDKKCTAACCVYNNDLQPAIHGIVGAIQQGGGTVNVPMVYPPSNSSYGSFSRAAYQVNVSVPNVLQSSVGGITGSTGGHVALVVLLIGGGFFALRGFFR